MTAISNGAVAVLLLVVGIGLFLLVISQKGRDTFDFWTGRARVVR